MRTILHSSFLIESPCVLGGFRERPKGKVSTPRALVEDLAGIEDRLRVHIPLDHPHQLMEADLAQVPEDF